MIVDPPQAGRALRHCDLKTDLVIVGGGLSGICAAITAAREGVHVVLLQDRPVLGGNASSEVRLWVLGATAHLFNNNRWSREGGVIDEILVENMWRNPEGNALIFDTLLLEKVIEEKGITLLLNTAVYDLTKSGPDRIESVRAFCSQNSTAYTVSAPLFVDASGDGIVGFLSGAAFRMGAEAQEEFGEKLAPNLAYGELLGHSIYFYSKDTGRPVKFIPPSFAMEDIMTIPRYKAFNTKDFGCRLWWIEYGGRLDTVHETETIKWELWKVVYGVWNFIKNSGRFPDAENLTLEWVGHIPGKRESRRFEGDYLLRQQDIVEQRRHADAVAFGGWAIDLHPSDGVFSEHPGCAQFDSKGIYEVPYRCLYSRNITNLFLAGRIISATHVAFASTRVMATCACLAQAVGVAAAICTETSVDPSDLIRASGRIEELQRRLLRTGHHIPRLRLVDPLDLARNANITASSEYFLGKFPANGLWRALENPYAQLLPVPSGAMPIILFHVKATEKTTLKVDLRVSERDGNFTPDHVLSSLSFDLQAGEEREIALDFQMALNQAQTVFIVWRKNSAASIQTTELRVTGIVAVAPRSWNEYQNPMADIGIESFELWCPERRPGGQNVALEISPPLAVFPAANLINGVNRPTAGHANAWLAALDDPSPQIRLEWDSPQKIGCVELFFDTDFDHPMESVLMGHPERVMPFCVHKFRLLDDLQNVLYEESNNHQTRKTIRLDLPVTTKFLIIDQLENGGICPIALFGVRVYE